MIYHQGDIVELIDPWARNPDEGPPRGTRFTVLRAYWDRGLPYVVINDGSENYGSPNGWFPSRFRLIVPPSETCALPKRRAFNL